MKKIIILILALVSLVSCPVYAANKLGLGIDLSLRKMLEEEAPLFRDERDEKAYGLRLYYEHLLRQFIGIQLEFGFSRSENYYYNQYNQNEFDLSGLLKYYFYLKGETSIYIGGGVGVVYREGEETGYYEEKIEEISIIEQATIGLQFPLSNRVSVFIEDRFKDELSDGQLRAGIYLNLLNGRRARRWHFTKNEKDTATDV